MIGTNIIIHGDKEVYMTTSFITGLTTAEALDFTADFIAEVQKNDGKDYISTIEAIERAGIKTRKIFTTAVTKEGMKHNEIYVNPNKNIYVDIDTDKIKFENVALNQIAEKKNLQKINLDTKNIPFELFEDFKKQVLKGYRTSKAGFIDSEGNIGLFI